MNKKIEHKKCAHPKRMNPIFKLFISIFILMPFLACAKVKAVSLPTISGTRTYIYGNTQASNGINGGNPNGIIPFEIIGAPPAGYERITLTQLNFGFSGNYGNAQNKYNMASVGFLFVQPATHSTNPKTFKKIQPVSSARLNDGNLISGNCFFPNENTDSLVLQCDYYTDNYKSFTDFYFVWGDGTAFTDIAYVSSMSTQNTNPITLSIGGIDVTSTSDPMVAGQQTIINQNQTIIDQNTRLETSQQVQNQLIQNQNDELQGVQDKAQQESQRGDKGANDAETANQQASTNIFGIVTKVVGAFTNAPNGNCVIPVVASGVDLGNIDLCSGKPPIWGQIVGGVVSIILVYACFRTALFIFQWFISLTAFAQGGGWNKGGDE